MRLGPKEPVKKREVDPKRVPVDTIRLKRDIDKDYDESLDGDSITTYDGAEGTILSPRGLAGLHRFAARSDSLDATRKGEVPAYSPRAHADATSSRYAAARDIGKHSGVEMREAREDAGLHPIDDGMDTYATIRETRVTRHPDGSESRVEGPTEYAPMHRIGARVPVARLEDLHGEVDPADMRRRHEEGVRLNGGYSDDSRDSAHDRPMLHQMTETMRSMPKKVMDSRGELSKDPEPGREYDERGRLKARSFGEGFEAFRSAIRGKGGR